MLCIYLHLKVQLAVGQNQWYHFGVGAPPILVNFSWDWDVRWGYDLAFDPWPTPAAGPPADSLGSARRRLGFSIR